MELLWRLHIFQLVHHSQKFGQAENLGDQLNFKSVGPEDQGPFVQSMVSLTSSLRGQLVKYFTTL